MDPMMAVGQYWSGGPGLVVDVSMVELPSPASPPGHSSPPFLLDLAAHSVGRRLTLESEVEELGLKHLDEDVKKYVSTIELFSKK